MQEDPAFDIQIVDIMGREWFNKLEVDRRKYNKVNAEFYNKIYTELSVRLDSIL